jgi:thiamine-monophosphate kinase
MKEFDLIARLTRNLPTHAGVIAGPGDDCALLDLGVPELWVVFKTDAVVEGIHFTPETPPEQVGHKAMARVLSDFAAAAATPTAAVVTLALPQNHDPARIEALYSGLCDVARRWNVAVVGGETTTNPERILVSIAVVGTVPKTRSVRRSGAQPGDALFVSGELGGSIAGHHLEFEPRLAEAHWLTEHFSVHAMIDLSDGLAGDLRHVTAASGVGAELMEGSLPIRRAAKLRARSGESSKSAVLAALTDGEDFELLFAVAKKDAVPVLDGWKARFPDVRLTCIGRVTQEPVIRLRDRQGPKPMPNHGYVHFA